MTTIESSLNGRYRQAALAIALLGLKPEGGFAATPAQDVPGLDGVSVPPASPVPTPTPISTPPSTRPARRPLPPPDVVPEPEGGAIGLGLPISSSAVRRPDVNQRQSKPISPTAQPTQTPSPTTDVQRILPVQPVASVDAVPIPTEPAPSSRRPMNAPKVGPAPVPESEPVPERAVNDPLAWALGAGFVVLWLAVGLIWLSRGGRKRKSAKAKLADRHADPVSVPPVSPLPTPTPAPDVPPASDQRQPSMLRPSPPRPSPTEPALRPWLEVDFVPHRAGTNLTSATVDFELAIRNIGSVVANDVRVMVQLLTANPHQNVQLQTVFDRPTDQPIMAPFALDPGDTARINAVGTLAFEKINRLELEGRPMFVPIMAVRAVYNWADNRGDRGSTANAYILGVGREGQGKMEPLWLDVGRRMVDRITYRLHEIGVRR